MIKVINNVTYGNDGGASFGYSNYLLHPITIDGERVREIWLTPRGGEPVKVYPDDTPMVVKGSYVLSQPQGYTSNTLTWRYWRSGRVAFRCYVKLLASVSYVIATIPATAVMRGSSGSGSVSLLVHQNDRYEPCVHTLEIDARVKLVLDTERTPGAAPGGNYEASTISEYFEKQYARLTSPSQAILRQLEQGHHFTISRHDLSRDQFDQVIQQGIHEERYNGDIFVTSDQSVDGSLQWRSNSSLIALNGINYFFRLTNDSGGYCEDSFTFGFVTDSATSEAFSNMKTEMNFDYVYNNSDYVMIDEEPPSPDMFVADPAPFLPD